MVTKKDKDSFWKLAAVASIAFIVLTVAGVISVSQTGITWNGWTVERDDSGSDNPEGDLVDLSIKVSHALDRGAPAATPIDVYDSQMNYIESASTSSGIATFGAPYHEGETIYLQIRATAPNSATYVTYTTPPMKYVVPEGDVNGDAELPVFNQLWELSTTAAYFNVTDQGSNPIYTEATYHLNTTDTQVEIKVTITADCVYGTPEDFTDLQTGRHYLAGAWLVIKCTAAQASLANSPQLVTHFYSASLEWYVFRIPMIVYDSDLGYQTSRTFTCGDGTTAFVASADFDFDIYDICWADSIGTISSSSFQNGDSDLNPGALVNNVS